jgi:predicted MFS family arabinose efflux permease
MTSSVGRMIQTTTFRTIPASRPRLVTLPLALALAISFGSLLSFYLLLSVVPAAAAAAGTGGVGAGMSTGALMFATVAAELIAAWLVTRFGYRVTLAAGLLLMGLPALALVPPAGVAAILLACALRGLGFGIVVVAGGALTARLLPSDRRGEGLGLFGIVCGVPGVIALPLGVWLADHAGSGPVFAAAAAAALVAMAALPGLPGREQAPERPLGLLAGLRSPALARPALAFGATAMAAGVVVTFLPLALSQVSGGLVALALFAQAVAATIARWWAGRDGDRHGPARLLVPGLLATAAGVLAVALDVSPAIVVAGMVVFGAGFGVMQNASLALMLGRVPKSGYAAVSGVWNLAYDGGMGVGGAGFGVLAAGTGYPVALALTAGLVLAAVAVARR